MGVSEKSVKRAKKTMREDPEAHEATTKHGEFGRKCAEAFVKCNTPCCFSDAELNTAKTDH